MMDTKFFGVSIDQRNCYRYEFVVNDRMNANERKIQRTHMIFDSFNYEELAVVSKDNEVALDVLLTRLNDFIVGSTKHYIYDKPYLSYENTFDKFNLAVVKAVQIFEPEKGEFCSFLARIFDVTFKELFKQEALEYHHRLESLGKRIQFTYDNGYSFEDYFVSPNTEKDLLFKIDFEEYLNSLSDDKKEIMLLYAEGRSFREIGDLLNKPASTISYQIYLMLSKLGIERNK